MRPEERYTVRYLAAIEKLRLDRQDVTFTEVNCLALRMNSFWVARGSAEMPWGREPLIFLGIGETWTVFTDAAQIAAMLERVETLFAKEIRYAHENADNQRTD